MCPSIGCIGSTFLPPRQSSTLLPNHFKRKPRCAAGWVAMHTCRRRLGSSDGGNTGALVYRGARADKSYMRELICVRPFSLGLSIAASCPHYYATRTKR